MTPRVLRFFFSLALGFGLLAQAGIAADDVKKEEPKKEDVKKEDAKKEDPKSPGETTPPDTTTSPKPSDPGPNYSGWVKVTGMYGEVVRATETNVTFRVFFLAQNSTNGKKAPRPSLHNHSRSVQNPYLVRKKNPGYHVDHHDYTIDFIPEGLVRTTKLAKKLDEKGNQVNYTNKELDEMKAPIGIPGYAASKSDLVPATVLDILLVRDKNISAKDVTEKDLRIKWVKIIGHDNSATSVDKSASAASTQQKKKN